MALQLNFLHKLSAANVALEPVMTGVPVHVVVEVALLMKSHVANLADVGSIFNVRTLVDDEPVLLHETFPALGTFVLSPVRVMDLLVRVQVSFLGVAFAAFVTFEGAVICVFTNVILNPNDETHGKRDFSDKKLKSDSVTGLEIFLIFRSIITKFALVLSVYIFGQIVC